MTQVGCDLSQPWDITYGPDDHLWVMESKSYELLRINPATGSQQVVFDASGLKNFSMYNNSNIPQGGFTGLALHPDLLNGKPYVYLGYVHQFDSCINGFENCIYQTKVVRYDYNSSNNSLSNGLILVDTIPGSTDHNGGRMTIGDINGTPYLFFSVGDMGAGQFTNATRPNKSQNPSSYEGKILRFNLEPDSDSGNFDRWIPNNNPYNGTSQSAVWSIGHRNPQGLVFGNNGIFYSAEHGAFTDDELNIIEGGKNYGHPLIGGFADGNYNNSKLGTGGALPFIFSEQNNATALGADYRDPIGSYFPAPQAQVNEYWLNELNGTQPFPFYYFSWEGIAHSGMEFYGSSAIPDWQNSILLASLKRASIFRVKLSSDGQSVVSDTIGYFKGMGRFRDIAISPDGTKIFVACDSTGLTSGPTAGTTIVPPNKGCILQFEYQPLITGCPNNLAGFTYLGEQNNSKYFISNTDAQPIAAQIAAENVNGHLAVINDQAENDFVQQNISEMVYIGLNDVQSEGNLEWVNGDVVSFNNIDPCGFCDENSTDLDYVIMAPWNGTWSFSSQWNSRKYIVEIPCNSSGGEVEITYDCPTEFPQVGIWSLPVTITNNTTSTQPAQELYLHHTYATSNPASNFLRGQVTVPMLAVGESVNLQIESDFIAPPFFYPNRDVFNTGFNPFLNFKEYFLSFDPLGFAETENVDFYCKKYATDLSVEILNPQPTYGTDNEINYSVAITNNGTETAVNIQTEFLRTISTASMPPNPYFFEVSGTDPVVWERLFGRQIIWYVEELAVGETKIIDVVYNIDGNGLVDPVPDEYLLEVEVMSGHLQDTNSSNNTAAFTFQKEDIGGGCPPDLSGFTSLGEYNGSKYFISDGTSQPIDAQLVAEQNGGYLAVITSQEENDFIQQNISDMAYIGLNDAQTEGSLEWVNGEALSYNNVNPCSFCESNDDGFDYVIIAPWNGEWSFSSQFNQRKYIIEVPCDDTGGGTPDLTLSNLSGLPSNTQVGNQIDILFDLNNIGTAAVNGEYVIAAYLSTDPLFGSGDTYLNAFTTGNTQIGTETDLPFSFTVPSLPDGDYYFIIIADVNGDVQELIPNNNSITLPISIGTSTGGCPPSIIGFTAIGEYNGSKYFISDGTSKPADAQLVAEQNGGYLAVINSQAENDFIQQGISDMVYIGLNDVQTEGSLTWVNGEAVNYNNINPCSFCDENSADLDYVIMAPWDGTWSFSSQWNSRKYIVEIPCGTNQGCSCTTVYEPVCGGDGITYSNSCEAECAGVFNYTNGECQTLPTDCPDGKAWTWLSASPTGIDLWHVDFVDNQNGWALGYDGLVLETNDGGLSWNQNELETEASFRGIDFVNENVGFLIGTRFAEGTFIYKTTDGGDTWTETNITSASPTSIFFLNEQVGWFVSTNGRIHKTTDGGNQWEFEQISANLQDIFFLNANEGWVVGEDGAIFKSIDGGLTWTPQVSNTVLDLNGVQFLDNQNGWIIGDLKGTLKTTDGGQTWINLPPPVPNSMVLFFRDFYFKNVSTGWIVGNDLDGPKIYYTDDAGTTWQEQAGALQNGARVELKEVAFLNDELWAVGDGGTIANSVNGIDWDYISSNNDLSGHYPKGIHFVDQQNGWLIDSDDFIWNTIDGGATWNTQAGMNISVTSLTDIFFTDQQNGWVASSTETIFRTTDGGQTWTPILHGLNIDIRRIFFSDSQNGWATGNSGKIIKTSDGGQTWALQQIPGAQSFITGIQFLDNQNGYAIEKTNLLKTSNGGQNWEVKPLPIIGNFRDLFFVDNQEGWVVGLQGAVLHTTDGGQTWEDQSLPINSFTSEIEMLDNQTGWLLSGRDVYYTDNGGKLWSKQETPIGYSDISIVDMDNVWATGGSTGRYGGVLRFETVIPKYDRMEFIGTFNNHEYYIGTKDRTYGGAKSHAEANGGYLAVINDQAENDFIQQNISEMMFIGLTDRINEGSLEWINGENVGFENIDVCNFCNENTEEFDFGLIHPWDGKWSFSNETSPRKYIVEVPCGTAVNLTNNNLLISQLQNSELLDQTLLQKVYPNPTMGNVFVTIQSPIEQKVDIQIFDARGSLVQSFKIDLIKGENTKELSIANLQGGFYSIQVPQAQVKHSTLRFMKVVD